MALTVAEVTQAVAGTSQKELVLLLVLVVLLALVGVAAIFLIEQLQPVEKPDYLPYYPPYPPPEMPSVEEPETPEEVHTQDNLEDCWSATTVPHPICSCDDLQNIQTHLDWSYAVQNDIDFSKCAQSYTTGSGFIPIGSDSSRFEGALDGKGHTLSGLYMYNPDYPGTGTGILRYIGSDGVVKDLKLADVTSYGVDHVGTLASRNYGKVEHCSATGAITGTDYGGTHGGLVAVNYGRIDRSFANVSVNGNHNGGLVSHNGGTIIDCYALGNVGAYGGNGGLVHNNVGTIINSYATGDASGGWDGNAGGLAGTNQGNISNSFSIGTATHQTNPPGGLVGLSDDGSKITNCYYYKPAGRSLPCVGSNKGIAECENIPTLGYFYDTSNLPMSMWDFDNVWIANGSFPVLR